MTDLMTLYPLDVQFGGDDEEEPDFQGDAIIWALIFAIVAMSTIGAVLKAL